MVRSEGNMSLKNPVTPPGIDPGTVRLVASQAPQQKGVAYYKIAEAEPIAINFPLFMALDIRKYGKKTLVLNPAHGSNITVTGTDIPVGETNTSKLIKLNVKSNMLMTPPNVLIETRGKLFQQRQQ